MCFLFIYESKNMNMKNKATHLNIRGHITSSPPIEMKMFLQLSHVKRSHPGQYIKVKYNITKTNMKNMSL